MVTIQSYAVLLSPFQSYSVQQSEQLTRTSEYLDWDLASGLSIKVPGYDDLELLGFNRRLKVMDLVETSFTSTNVKLRLRIHNLEYSCS